MAISRMGISRCQARPPTAHSKCKFRPSPGSGFGEAAPCTFDLEPSKSPFTEPRGISPMENRAAPGSRNLHFKPIAISLGLLTLFGSTFIPIHRISTNSAFIVASAFPIVAGWLLGLRLGLIFWFLHAMLLMVLAHAVGSRPGDLVSSGIPAFVVNLLVTCAMGRIKDLTRTLQLELKERHRVELELQQYKETLEAQVEERSQDLLRTNELLKQEIIHNERANEEKLNLQANLKRAEKMEAVGILAGSVAHDLNNILSGIQSYPELLLLDIPEHSPLRKPLLTIQRSGQRAAAVVQDLLTLVRKGIINSEVTNLNQLISDFLHSPECKRMEGDHPGTSLVTDLQPDLLRMHGSPVHLARTMMNLILNAMESMPRGGQLRIATANVHLDRSAGTYDVMGAGDYVSVKISDTGDGIAQEDLERIFEPFYTKKVMGRSGTGLGLAIVWGTVKDHGGFLDVESREEEGTTFTLYFPATRQEALSHDPGLNWNDFAGAGESILIIDDEKLQREIATDILEKLGYAVHSVPSGEAAIDYLMDHSVDLLLVDMIMAGGIDGFETYRRITEMHPGQKAIIVSGFSASEDVRGAQAIGAGTYVKKPYTLGKLAMAVKNEIRGKVAASTDPDHSITWMARPEDSGATPQH